MNKNNNWSKGIDYLRNKKKGNRLLSEYKLKTVKGNRKKGIDDI